MGARALQHGESAVDISAEIRLRVLDRGHDISPRGEMENALDALAGLVHGGLVGHVAFDDLKRRIAAVVRQIGPAADNETVDDTNLAAFGQETVNQVAADKSGPACD